MSWKVDQGVNDDDFWLDASKMHSKYSFQLRYWNWSRKGFKYFEWIIAAHFAAKVKKNISKYFITNLSRFQNCRLKSISTKLNYQRKFSAMAESVESNFAYYFHYEYKMNFCIQFYMPCLVHFRGSELELLRQAKLVEIPLKPINSWLICQISVE